MKTPTIVLELAECEAAMSLVAALAALSDAKGAIDEAILTASTSLAGREMSPVQVLVHLTRMAGRLLQGRLEEVEILAFLSPAQCQELVRLGGTRSEPDAGVVSTVTLAAGGGAVELRGAERPEPGTVEAEAEAKAFDVIDEKRLRKLGPTGESVGVMMLLGSAHEAWQEACAEVARARAGEPLPDRIERIAEALDAATATGQEPRWMNRAYVTAEVYRRCHLAWLNCASVRLVEYHRAIRLGASSRGLHVLQHGPADACHVTFARIGEGD